MNYKSRLEMTHTYFQQLVRLHVPGAASYDFLARTGYANDVCYAFDEIHGRWIDKRTIQAIENGYLDTRLLLEYLCHINILNPSDYLIKVRYDAEERSSHFENAWKMGEVCSPENYGQDFLVRCVRQVG